MGHGRGSPKSAVQASLPPDCPLRWHQWDEVQGYEHQISQPFRGRENSGDNGQETQRWFGANS